MIRENWKKKGSLGILGYAAVKYATTNALSDVTGETGAMTSSLTIGAVFRPPTECPWQRPLVKMFESSPKGDVPKEYSLPRSTIKSLHR